MHIHVIAVGKLKERFWKEACAEYEKRLTRYCTLRVVELDDCDPARHGGEKAAREAEAASIRKVMPGSGGAGRYVACLDVRGKLVSSEDLSEFVDDRALEGCRDLVLVIGGPTGIDDGFKREADALISFGKITLPHNLARVVLLEQLYRAFRISRNEPYHK